MSRSRKSRPKSPFLKYVLGKAHTAAFPTGVPTCTECRGPRQAVQHQDIPANIWDEKLAPLWEMMQAQGQAPGQIAYCAKCAEYGILGGWQSF